MAKGSSTTPLMRQYHAIKEQVPDALLLFRLGDFYELFFDDAIVASRDLGITLTSRNKEKGEKVPMCGVPVRTVDTYIAKLIEKGRRVAVCDQVEDPKKAKKIVRREVTRIVTPGTASDFSLLKAGVNNYLAAVAERRGVAGLAYVDISTGEFRMTELAPEQVESALETLGARELLAPSAGPLFEGREANGRGGLYLRTEVEPWTFDFEYAERLLRDHYGLHSLDGLGAAGRQAAVSAAGALLHYLRDTQRAALEHLERPAWVEQRRFMGLDPVTIRNLELVEPLFGGPPKSTLIHTIDRTCTPMGSRLIRKRLLQPSLDRGEIEARLGGVDELLRETITRTEIRRELDGVLDIERLLARVTLGSATPRDLAGLGASLRCLPMLRCLVGQLAANACANCTSGSTSWPTSATASSTRSPRRRRCPSPTAASSRPASTPSSTSCARSARTAAATSPSSKPASASAPASPRSRCATTACSASTSRSPRPIATSLPRTTSASRPWSTPSASSRPSSRNTKPRCSRPRSASSTRSGRCSRPSAPRPPRKPSAFARSPPPSPSSTCSPAWPSARPSATTCAPRSTTTA